MPLSLNGASIITPTRCHSSPGRPFPMRASRGLETSTAPKKQQARPLRRAILPTSQARPGLLHNPPPPPLPPPEPRVAQSPLPGSWTADETLPAARLDRPNSRVSPGLSPRGQVGTNRSEPTSLIFNHWNTGAVDGEGCDAHKVSRQILSTRPGPAAPTTHDSDWYGTPARGAANGTLSKAVTQDLTTGGRLPVTTSPHPLRYPSRSTTQVPSRPWCNPDTEVQEEDAPVD